jgi:hypothetical protein
MGITDPIRPLNIVIKTIEYVQGLIFDREVYSQQVLSKTQQDKLCIFVPHKKLMTKMIMALVKYSKEADERFFLRFGLVDTDF